MDTQRFIDPCKRNADSKNLSFTYENVFTIAKMLTAKDKFYQISFSFSFLAAWHGL